MAAGRPILAPEVFGPDQAPPTTPIEALQRSGPFEPEKSTMERSHPLEAAIDKALSGFSELDRDMVIMHLVAGLSIRQIAGLTGLSKSDVGRRLPKLKERLATAMRGMAEFGKYTGEQDVHD